MATYCLGSWRWPEGTRKVGIGRAICGVCGKDVHATRMGAVLRAHHPPAPREER